MVPPTVNFFLTLPLNFPPCFVGFYCGIFFFLYLFSSHGAPFRLYAFVLRRLTSMALSLTTAPRFHCYAMLPGCFTLFFPGLVLRPLKPPGFSWAQSDAAHFRASPHYSRLRLLSPSLGVPRIFPRHGVNFIQGVRAVCIHHLSFLQDFRLLAQRIFLSRFSLIFDPTRSSSFKALHIRALFFLTSKGYL